MKDYTPFMDLHPELKLVPTTSVYINISNFQNRFDYVQDFNRKENNGSKENFHLLVKDGKFGVLLHSSGFFYDTDSIALQAIYDSINFIYRWNKSFGAIVEKNGKFGLIFWEYGLISNDMYSVPIEYDSMEIIENKRIKAIKGNTIVYFDMTGHILK